MPSESCVLVVEDDASVRTSLNDAFALEGYRVLQAATAESGTRLAREAMPHLVILDVRLPDGSGIDVCRNIRESALRMPVLFLTACDDEVDKIVGLEVGGDDYITKPYRLRELLARTHAHMRRAYGSLATAGSDLLYAHDLVIDRTKGIVSRKNREIPLTPIEFRLLVHFAQHPSQVFSRGQLFKSVWGYDADLNDENTVKVHVRRLREKVEPDPAAPTMVVTVRGLGYRLQA